MSKKKDNFNTGGSEERLYLELECKVEGERKI